jgi:outer membrane autotransporter protein
MQRIRLLAHIGGALLGVTVLATPHNAAADPPYSVLFPGTGLLTLPGMTDAQLKMAQSIDNVCPTINGISPGSDLANVCNNMVGTAVTLQGQANPLGLTTIPGITTVDGLKSALTQLDGGAETLIPTNQASMLRNLQGSALASRLSVLHMRMLGGGAATSDTPMVLALADGYTAKDAPGLLLAQNSPTEVSLWHDKLGLFFNAIGQFGSSSATGSQNGYDFYNAGFLAGADYRLTDHLTLGAAFGYTHSNTDFDTSPQSAPGQYLRGNLLEGSLYATWYPTDSLYFDAVGSIGGGDNDSQRVVVLPGFANRTASGSFGTQTYGIAVGGGYAIPFDALTVTPTARFEYRQLHSNSFTESGAAGLDLTYGRASENAVLSFLGAQVQYAISTNFGVITPTARFNWAHQYNNGVTAIGIAYAEDPSGLSAFTLTGDRAARNYYDLGVGAALQLANNWSGFINYDAIVGVNHTSFNSFTAGVRFAF